MGKVGDDDFGHFLAKTLTENGVDTTPLVFSAIARTALAFVSLTAAGERDFMFYRHPSADMLFEPSEVDRAGIEVAKIFHYGSISLISEPSKSATLYAVEIAKNAGVLISYDPNLRLPLWPSAAAARDGLLEGWRYAEIAKISDEEVTFLTGQTDLAAGVADLWHSQLKLVVVTQGGKGSIYFNGQTEGYVAGFEVKVADTTGAGDGFVAGLLVSLLENPSLWQEPTALVRALAFANGVGALTTTQLGAIPALPTRQAVLALLEKGAAT
jgi:fructokinase